MQLCQQIWEWREGGGLQEEQRRRRGGGEGRRAVERGGYWGGGGVQEYNRRGRGGSEEKRPLERWSGSRHIASRSTGVLGGVKMRQQENGDNEQGGDESNGQEPS